VCKRIKISIPAFLTELKTGGFQCRGQRMNVAIPPLPQYAFMAWCSVMVDNSNEWFYCCFPFEFMLSKKKKMKSL